MEGKAEGEEEEEEEEEKGREGGEEASYSPTSAAWRSSSISGVCCHVRTIHGL